VTLLCQALRFDDAGKVARRALKRFGSSPGSAAMFVAVARAAALSGDFAAVAAAAKRARKLLDEEQQNNWDMSWGSGGGSDAVGSGGKRGADKEAGPARTRSLEVFQSHRRGELMAELKEVEAFAKKATSVDLAALWSRTVAFEDSLGSQQPQASVGVSAALLRSRLCESFGMSAESKVAKQAGSAFAAAIKGPASLERPRKKKRTGGEPSEGQDGRLDLRALFPLSGDGGDAAAKPLHLEVCSGDGEWLCGQALLAPAACWVACELRFDRAARCLQRFALRGLARPDANAGVIAGDASDALTRRLLPASCSHLFVNHPEPPHQTDLETAISSSAPASEAGAQGGGEESTQKKGKGKDKGKGKGKGKGKKGKDVPEPAVAVAADTHLLTPTFLRDACGTVVKAGGTLTICTDSLEYGKWLLNTVASPSLAEVFEDALHGKKSGKEGRLEQVGNFALRTSPPPPEVCGADYAGEAGASYFQRLKKSEQRSRHQEELRYFLCLRRRS